jgi:hypothetical protein
MSDNTDEGTTVHFYCTSLDGFNSDRLADIVVIALKPIHLEADRESKSMQLF